MRGLGGVVRMPRVYEGSEGGGEGAVQREVGSHRDLIS